VIRTRMEVLTEDGQRHVADVTNPRGHHTNPLSDKEVKDKFRLGAEEKLGKERCEKAIEWLWSVDRAKSVGELFPLVEDRRQKG
jgi:2-methylcitrate dehydratase PrpD